MSPPASGDARCVAIWTRDFRDEAAAGRPSIARAIIAAMDESQQVEHVVLEHGLGRLATPAALLAALRELLLERWPLQTILYSEPKQRRALLERLARSRPRSIYLDTIRCLALARDIRRVLPDCRLVLDMDDLLSRRFEGWRKLDTPLALGYVASSTGRLAALLSAGPVRSLLLRYEIRALRRAERRALDVADTIVLVSPHEAGLLGGRAAAAGRGAIVVIPPAKALRRPALPRHWPLTFIFIGSDRLLQNSITIDRLIALWRRHRPASPLEIFGSMDRPYDDLPPGVRLRGFAPDLDDVYGVDRVLLAPSYIDGGIKTKVLEAFAHGCPVVGNASTFEGLGLVDYPLVCDDDAALAGLVEAPQDRHPAFDRAVEMGQALLAARHQEAWFRSRWREILDLGPGVPT